MLKYAIVINEETKECEVGLGEDISFYQSLGMTEQEVELSYNGSYYLKGYEPTPTIEEQNEKISQTRQALFSQYADPLKFNYEECSARYGEEDERTIEAKNVWLAKKDEIRFNNPYISD